MAEILKKSKSWTAIIADLKIGETALFSADNERSISAIISGNNRGGLKEKYPNRKFKTQKIPSVDPDTFDEIEVLEVKRTA